MRASLSFVEAKNRCDSLILRSWTPFGEQFFLALTDTEEVSRMRVAAYRRAHDVRRRELSIAIHTKRTIVVTRRYRKCCVRNSKDQSRTFCKLFRFYNFFFLRTGWVTRKRHRRDTFKPRLEYQCWKNNSDKNVIYVRLAAIFCIFCI